jgi:hypothetical protein
MLLLTCISTVRGLMNNSRAQRAGYHLIGRIRPGRGPATQDGSGEASENVLD